MRQVCPWHVGFATVRPDTVEVGTSEFALCHVPAEIQIAAFLVPEHLEPNGIHHDQLYAEIDSERKPDCTVSMIVLRVEQDHLLVKAAAADLIQRIRARQFDVQQWLLWDATHKYSYVVLKVWQQETPK